MLDASQVDLSMIPLERYAELTVVLAAGEDRAKALRRYVLTEEVFIAVATKWSERMKREPSLHTQFLELVQAFKRAREDGGR